MGQVKKVPVRKCIGCQEMKNKKDMMRILKTTENEIVLDTTGKKNGRGAYLCFSKECFEKAVKNKGLERSLKMAIPGSVYEELKKEIERLKLKASRVLSLVGLATKAGRTASGEFSTEKAVKEGRAFLVIVSEESSDNTKKKFQNMCTYYQVPIWIYGTKEQLGAAMGKEFRASLAVLDEGFSKTIMKELEKEKGKE